MTRFLFCLLICGLAAPVLAEPTDYIRALPAGTPVGRITYDVTTGALATGRDAGRGAKFLQYSDTVNSGYYGNSAGHVVGDDLHEEVFPFPTSITELVFGYSAPTPYNPGTTISATILLLDNPGGNDTAFGATMTVIELSGLPQGSWILSVEGLNVPKPSSDLWFLVDYSSVANGGPILTLNPGGNVGYSHDLFVRDGYLVWGHAWYDFLYEVRGVPEPTTIALVAAAGVLMLRRQSDPGRGRRAS